MKILIVLTLMVINFPPELINDRYHFLFLEPHRSIPFQILYGGASSGKSVSIAQRDVFDIINEERNFLIVRKTGGTLRQSVFEERKKVIEEWGLTKYFDIKESLMSIMYVPKKRVMIFRGLDDVEKLKSITVPNGVITDLRVEEATEIAESDLDELERRMRGASKVIKRVVLSFNPTFRRHWIARKYFKGRNIGFACNDDMLILRTTYRDNKFLTQQDVKKILALKGYQGDVYRDGLWGILGGLVFNNWEIGDIRGLHFDRTRYGIDFGFADDPAAIVKAGYQKSQKKLYLQRGLYVFGGTNDVLAAKAKPITGNNTVYCDNQEPKSIAELRKQGENRILAQPCKKGRDSVWHGIQWLQQLDIVIDKREVDAIDEFSAYAWKKNKLGETLNEPEDKNNHIIDALRYATERDRLGTGVNILV